MGVVRLNLKLEKFKKEINGKKIAVIGIATSNIPAIKYLHSMGADITAFDSANREKVGSVCDELEEMNVKLVLGEDYLENIDSTYEYIFRAPGVKPFLKEIDEAVKGGSILTSEIEMLLEYTPCKVIGVTGSDGKTTTTTLIAKFLEQAGKKVYLGGNIGIPLFSKLDEMTENDFLVLELSSFQLMTAAKCRCPNIAVVTNITPNHLDYHRNYEEYIEAKKNIFKNQRVDDIVIINDDDEIVSKFDKEVKVNVRRFSLQHEIDGVGAYLDNNKVHINDGNEKQILDDICNIKMLGKHNIANIEAAMLAVIDFVSLDDIRTVIRSFGGVEHRIEFVRELNNVKYYNSSIDSSPSRTIASLEVFNQKVILIAGGNSKDVPYDVLGPILVDKTKAIILNNGPTSKEIEKALRDEEAKRNVSENIPVYILDTYEDIVKEAYDIAKEGDIVLLSPASTSFDMFKSYTERGNIFKKLVNELEK